MGHPHLLIRYLKNGLNGVVLSFTLNFIKSGYKLVVNYLVANEKIGVRFSLPAHKTKERFISLLFLGGIERKGRWGNICFPKTEVMKPMGFIIR